MTTYGLRLVVEKIDLENPKKIITRDELSTIPIKKAKNIIDLGLRHQEQIDILKMIQDSLLAEQAVFLKPDIDECAECHSELFASGFHTSKFHAIFTDHEIKIQRKKCKNKACASSITPTVKSVFGTSVHPDLYRLQCEQGSKHSYRKAEDNLSDMCCQKRSVNNHDRIKKITNHVGEVISEKNKIFHDPEDLTSAKELIVQVDGGYIKSNDAEKRSFEAMSAKIYRPESLVQVTETKSCIFERTCVASAKDDKQSSMKAYVLTAAKLEGLSHDTVITGLADGAKNCWNILKSLKNHCGLLVCILDWFHIAKKFENAKKSFLDLKKFNEIKNLIWNGKIDAGLEMLLMLKNGISQEEDKTKINGLYIYLNRNKEYIVNYNERAKNELPYTSQVAESTVEHLINDRHKRNQKMQWTRDGVHNVLQIRALMASNQWESVWQDAVFEAIKLAA